MELKIIAIRLDKLPQSIQRDILILGKRTMARLLYA